jgi:predicted O-methyltransferase YrrM
MTSLELAQHGPKAPSYDFIFIDGEHTYAAVLADLHAWYYSVRPGGLCGGHDFGLACVAEAVSEFAKTLSYTPEIKTCQDGCWYWTIPKA